MHDCNCKRNKTGPCQITRTGGVSLHQGIVEYLMYGLIAHIFKAEMAKILIIVDYYVGIGFSFLALVDKVEGKA